MTKITRFNSTKDETTRPDAELLTIMRDRTADIMIIGGLCRVAYDLWFCDVITFEERNRILFIIRLHAPKRAKSAYSWPQGEVAPRIEWLNMILLHIKNRDSL